MSWKLTKNEKICPKCGKSFQPSSNSQKYCRDCIGEAKRQRSKDFRKRDKERNADLQCSNCGGKYGAKLHGVPYCFNCLRKLRQYGSFENPHRTTSKCELFGDAVKVTTRSGAVFIADAEDYEKIKGYSWWKTSTGYAAARSGNKQIFMHRLLTGENDSEFLEVDHINGDKSDNRKANLRVCMHRENIRNGGIRKNNTSGYPGICVIGGRYHVQIMVNYKSIHIGTFPTLEQAVSARKAAEDKYHGEFAGHLRREKEGVK